MSILQDLAGAAVAAAAGAFAKKVGPDIVKFAEKKVPVAYDALKDKAPDALKALKGSAAGAVGIAKLLAKKKFGK